MRVLLAELEPVIARWPTMELQWIEALPAITHRTRVIGPALRSGVSWSQTRLLGWPPSEFVCRPKQRVADTLLLTTLRWTIERVADIRRSASASAPGVDQAVRAQLDVAQSLLEIEPVAAARSARPDRVDLEMVRAEGDPWTALADAAIELVALDEASLLDLARRLIAPTEERWRLFHLAVLGVFLGALRERGHSYVSLRPLSATSAGPAFEVVDGSGRLWDMWFEAAGMWTYYDVASPYASAAAGVSGAGGPLGTDIALVRPGEAALLLDCKYSLDPSVVARDGYRAAAAYAAEAEAGLAQEIVSVAVGPQDVIDEPGFTELPVGRVGIVPPTHIGPLLTEFLAAAAYQPPRDR